jgi:hypothetical protein
MTISDQKTLQDISREFHQMFPGLKLEFYAKAHAAGEGSPVQERLPGESQLSKVRTIEQEGDLEIDPEMSVSQFEQLFAERYGLNVQVFRKSGNLWMQTTSTDHWSLAQQNRKGGASEIHYKEKHDS